MSGRPTPRLPFSTTFYRELFQTSKSEILRLSSPRQKVKKQHYICNWRNKRLSGLAFRIIRPVIDFPLGSPQLAITSSLKTKWLSSLMRKLQRKSKEQVATFMAHSPLYY